MARFASIALVLLVFVAVLVLTTLNPDSVVLQYYFGRVELPLSLALVVALLLGAVLGMLSSLGRLIRMRREIVRLRRSVETAKREVENLRVLPLRDAR